MAAHTAQFMCAWVTDAASFARMVYGRPETGPLVELGEAEHAGLTASTTRWAARQEDGCTVSGTWRVRTELVEPASVQHLPRKAAAKEEEQRVGQAFQVVPPAGRPAQVCMHAGVPHCAPACYVVG